MQTFHPRGHAARRDPRDLFDLAVLGAIAQIRGMGLCIGDGEVLVGGELVVESAHDVVGFEHRHGRRGRGMRQVVERGKRGAVRQPRCGGHHRRVAAHASRRDAEHASRGAAELLAQNGEVGLADRGERRGRHRGLQVAGVETVVVRVPAAPGTALDRTARQGVGVEPGSGTPTVTGATVCARPASVTDRTSCDIQSVRVCSTSSLTDACSCGSSSGGRSSSTR